MNQEQINRILDLQKKARETEAAFIAALEEANYKDVWTGSYEDTRHYLVHPDFAEQAEKNSEFMGINRDWLDTLPPGIVLEP